MQNTDNFDRLIGKILLCCCFDLDASRFDDFFSLLHLTEKVARAYFKNFRIKTEKRVTEKRIEVTTIRPF